MQMVKGMAVMLNSLYKKLLSAILRSAFAVMLVMDFFADDLTLYLVNFFFPLHVDSICSLRQPNQNIK